MENHRLVEETCVLIFLVVTTARSDSQQLQPWTVVEAPVGYDSQVPCLTLNSSCDHNQMFSSIGFDSRYSRGLSSSISDDCHDGAVDAVCHLSGCD